MKRDSKMTNALRTGELVNGSASYTQKVREMVAGSMV